MVGNWAEKLCLIVCKLVSLPCLLLGYGIPLWNANASVRQNSAIYLGETVDDCRSDFFSSGENIL